MDFQSIIEEVERSGKKDFKVKCPFHVAKQPDGSLGQEKTPSFGVNIEKHVFKCFGCDMRGTFVRLKALLDGITYEQAKWDLYRGAVPDSLLNSYLNSQEEEEDIFYPEAKLASLKPAGEIEERGIGKEESDLYGLLKDSEHNLYGPLRDSNYRLRGCQMRYREESEGRYGHFLYYKGGNLLFGEHLAPKKPFRLILTEGWLDAVKLWGVLGVPAWAIVGSHLAKNQFDILAKYPITEIILWMDNDFAGRKAKVDNYNRLKKSFPITITTPVYAEESHKDPSDSDDDEIRSLWESRVWVPKLG